MIKLIRNLKHYSSVLVVAALFVTGCGGEKLTQEKVVTDLQSSSLGFKDTDDTEKQVSGKVMLDSPASLNKLVKKWVVYWSDSSTERGKTIKACETTTISAGVLCELKDAKVSGKHLIAYAADAEGKEFFTKLSVAIEDKFTKVEPPKEEPKEVKPEEKPAEEAVVEEKPAEEPVVEEKPVVVAEEPVVEEKPVVVEEKPVVVEETPVVVAETPVVEETPVVVAETPVTEEQPVEEPEPPKPVTILLDNVLYDFDKAELQDQYMTYLDETFENAVDKANKTFVIAGHADERGSNEYNLALGERRAYAVKRYLISLGFYEENIRIISYGEEKPVETGHNETAWMKNRRAVTELTQ